MLLWQALRSAAPVDLDAAAHVAQPEDLATVIYTSGTTGDPKGVMLDHTNVCWTKESLRLALDFSTEGFRVVSYLPMAHIAERMVSHYSGLALGYEVTTCPDLHLVLAAFQETRPQLLFGVPRTYERINSGVRAVLAGDAEREAVFDRALAVGREVAAVRARGDEPGGDLAEKWERVDAETLRPVRELLGLGEVRCAVTAAAPIPVEILDFFRALGVPLSELYGLSESSGPVTWEPRRVRPGTVGRAIPGLELRLDADGEVLCRGGNIFRGYLGDPARTAEALDADGWLHTGDVGALDADGYLRIVDRKKELIITAGGKNVSPANLEAALKAQPLIGQACAIGDGEPYVVALVVLDPDVAPVWAAAHGIVPGGAGEGAAAVVALAADDRLVAEVAHEVHEANDRSRACRAGAALSRAGRGVAPRLRRAHAHHEAETARDPREVRRSDRGALPRGARRRARAPRVGRRVTPVHHEVGELGDDLGDAEVLRRVDARDAGFHERGLVGFGDDAAHDDRRVDARLAQESYGLGDEIAMRSREHGQPDEIDVLIACGGRDLLGREADALVDHLHPRVTRGNRDLLRAVRVPVEAGFAHEDAYRMPERAGAGLHALPGTRQVGPDRRVRTADAGGCAVLAEDVAQCTGPLAHRSSGLCEVDRCRHQVVVGRRGRA